MKNNITVLLVGVAVVAVGLWAVFSGIPKTSGQTIKIGVIVPLSGNLAFLGEAGRNAALLAMEEIQADTSLAHSYELVIEDDAFDPARAASAINKLISIDHVDVVISTGSGGGNVVAPIAEQNKIPHIGLASDSMVARGDFNFIHWTRPQEEVDVMVMELGRRNLKKVAIIGVSNPGFQAITTDFKNKAGKAGITVVDDQEFSTGTTDFKTIITSSETKNPEIYLFTAFSPEIEILAKQMKELGVTQPVTSVESFGLSGTPEVFEGQWYVDSAVVTSDFAKAYRAKYGVEPGPTAANIYDAVHLLVRAVEAADKSAKPSGDEIAKALGGIKNYSGAFGPLSISPDGALISQPSVKVIKNGKPSDM